MARYLIGLGNYTMQDDSIGLRIADHINENGLAVNCEALSLPDGGLDLIEYFTPQTEKIVLIDAVRMELNPGESRVFGFDDVDSRKYLTRMTTHESDILQVIELGKEISGCLPRIRIIGIQPERVSLGLELSETLSKRFEEYVAIAIREIAG